MKQANEEDGFSSLPEQEVDLAIAPKLSAPKAPKTLKTQPLKLTTGTGKSKPAYTHEFKTNSPYNTK